jgi:hypothetical protein
LVIVVPSMVPRKEREKREREVGKVGTFPFCLYHDFEQKQK